MFRFFSNLAWATVCGSNLYVTELYVRAWAISPFLRHATTAKQFLCSSLLRYAFVPDLLYALFLSNFMLLLCIFSHEQCLRCWPKPQLLSYASASLIFLCSWALTLVSELCLYAELWLYFWALTLFLSYMSLLLSYISLFLSYMFLFLSYISVPELYGSVPWVICLCSSAICLCSPELCLYSPELHFSVLELYISVSELHISVPELYISVLELYVYVPELYVSVPELYVSDLAWMTGTMHVCSSVPACMIGSMHVWSPVPLYRGRNPE